MRRSRSAFYPLAEDVAAQTIPLLAEGGEEQEPALPDALTATTCQRGEGERVTIQGVSWTAKPAYDQTPLATTAIPPFCPRGIPWTWIRLRPPSP